MCLPGQLIFVISGLHRSDKSKHLTLNCQSLSSDVISQKIYNNTLDLGFTYNPPPDEKIKTIKKIPIKFIMVSSEEKQKVLKALESNYIYVDWGTSFSEAHSEHFQEIPVPFMRMDLGRIAKNYIRKCGGAAYLPETMVRRDIEKKVLFPVEDAPVIKRSAYAILNSQNQQEKTIRELFKE